MISILLSFMISLERTTQQPRPDRNHCRSAVVANAINPSFRLHIQIGTRTMPEHYAGADVERLKDLLMFAAHLWRRLPDQCARAEYAPSWT